MSPGQQGSQAGELIPTLGFGIPGSEAMVLILAALTIHGLIPGPLLVQNSPGVLAAAVAGLAGGSILVAVIGWPITRVLLRAATMNRSVVLPVALAVTLVGVFSLNRSLFDVGLMLVFGLVGYFMLRYGYSTAAAAIAVVLGGGLESGLRQGLVLTGGSLSDFVLRPITGTVLLIALAFLVFSSVQTYRLGRKAAPAESLEESASRESPV